MKASLIRMLANGVVRRPHVTTAMPFPEYPVSYNPSLARKKREMMDKCTNDLLTVSWLNPDETFYDPLVRSENLIEWYRGFFHKHGNEETDGLKDLYFAAEELYKVNHACKATNIISQAILSLKNEIIRASGPMGGDTSALEPRLQEEVKGTWEAFQQLLESLPHGSPQRQKVKQELTLGYIPIKHLTRIPGWNFGTTIANGFTSISERDERNKQELMPSE